MFRLLNYNDGKLSFNLESREEMTSPSNRFTVVIGANGTGKSQLLKSLVGRYQEQRPDQPQQHIQGVLIEDQPPRSLLALSNLVTDSFPFSRKRESNYRYLGLKQNNNSTSTGSLIDITVSAILNCYADPERSRMIAPAISTLGYDEYEIFLTRTPKYREAAPQFEKQKQVSGFLSRFPHLRGEENLEQLSGELTSELAQFIGSFFDPDVSRGVDKRGVAHLSALARKYRIDVADISRLLKRAGFCEVKVQLRREGEYRALEELSAGQLMLLSTIARLASNVSEGALILIDEPETGLHPNWQSEFIPLLRLVVPRELGCHFFLATHSPHIVADGTDVLFPGDRWGHFLEFADPFNGRSVENILYRVFHARVTGNSMVEDDLAALMEYLAMENRGGNPPSGIAETIARLRGISGPDTETLNAVLDSLPQHLGGLL